jgi:ribitol 2-dehydrogenase
LAARSVEKIEALAKELGENTLAIPTDITKGADIESMVSQALQRFGRIDVLFANAGIYIPGVVAEGDPEAWAHLIEVNVTGVMRCARAVLPSMLAQKSGDILVTSSISGCIDIVWEPIYSASKHAVQTFVHTLRRQVAPAGVRVGSLAPGMVANELWGFTTEEAIEKQIANHASLRSEDVADAAIFMLSQPPHVTIRDLVMVPQNQDL